MKQVRPEQFTAGQSIVIFIGGSVGFSSVVVEGLHGTIDMVTVKAIKVKFDNGMFLWFPKSALIQQESAYSDNEMFRLAKWFNFERNQWRVVERVRTIHGFSCA